MGKRVYIKDYILDVLCLMIICVFGICLKQNQVIWCTLFYLFFVADRFRLTSTCHCWSNRGYFTIWAAQTPCWRWRIRHHCREVEAIKDHLINFDKFLVSSLISSSTLSLFVVRNASVPWHTHTHTLSRWVWRVYENRSRRAAVVCLSCCAV